MKLYKRTFKSIKAYKCNGFMSGYTLVSNQPSDKSFAFY